MEHMLKTLIKVKVMSAIEQRATCFEITSHIVYFKVYRNICYPLLSYIVWGIKCNCVVSSVINHVLLGDSLMHVFDLIYGR